MIIGRDNELALLKGLVKDEYSKFVAVYGRRRVGKTFLVREAFGYKFTFQHAGLYNGNRAQQLEAFYNSLDAAGYKMESMPKNWLQAFDGLRQLIQRSKQKKKIVFLDELSWMDTHRSDFMIALEFFWNSWASARKDIILIVCASATSWMIKKIIHNKGGLYNRLSLQIHLRPFTLCQCEEFAKKAKLLFPRLQLTEYYMVAGGVPYYWTLLSPKIGLSQNIDKIFFDENAPLKKEFDYLFSSLFDSPEPYLEVVQALASHKTGMTRLELIKATSLTDCGPTRDILNNLESCDFIRKFYILGKKKEAIYQLIDNFTLFHYKFLHDKRPSANFWTANYNTPGLNSWRGLAFERVCLLHMPEIKQALGISGTSSNEYAWKCNANEELGIDGSQIDMLIDRADENINICEAKFSRDKYVCDKEFEEDFHAKLSDFMRVTKTRKTLFGTLITTIGLKLNQYSSEIQDVITLNHLFQPINSTIPS